jgi:lipopolysaccharide/colanic/teichoic acid biosynthesis glycosyltransferase
VGLEGKCFEILKFRTMFAGAEALGRETLGTADPRITRIGALLRKSKLDELPQLINVARGEMSLVGPRPEIPFYADRYSAADRVVLSVRPGITDPSSLALADLDEIMASRGDESAADFYVRVVQPKKLALQKAYVRERSFGGDLSVITRTIVRVFLK